MKLNNESLERILVIDHKILFCREWIRRMNGDIEKLKKEKKKIVNNENFIF